jgi:hypothetical protein
LLAAGLIASYAASVPAATITVTSSDAVGQGTLSKAIFDAQPGDTIDFNLAYPATIRFTFGLTLNKNLTIAGPGRDKLTLDGNLSDQFFMLTITSGTTVTLSNVQIANANALAINNQGTLTLNDSLVSRNDGSVNNTGTFTANDTVFTYNVGANWGGAVVNRGNAMVNRCSFMHNDARIGGAAIFTDTGATLVVHDSAFLSNESGFGEPGSGGALLNWGTATVNNSTFNGNISANNGTGGAMENKQGTLTVNNSTLSGNIATSGSGISNYGTTTVRRTILDGSCVGDAMVSAGDNMSSAGSCLAASVALNDSPNIDLRLDALGDNGGPTLTVALLPGSPAIDAVIVNAAGCSGSDQRGVARPMGVRCDIGAYELDSDRIFADGFD